MRSLPQEWARVLSRFRNQGGIHWQRSCPMGLSHVLITVHVTPPSLVVNRYWVRRDASDDPFGGKSCLTASPTWASKKLRPTQEPPVLCARFVGIRCHVLPPSSVP